MPKLFGRNEVGEIVWSDDPDVQAQFRDSVRSDFPIVKEFAKTFGDPFEGTNFDVIGRALVALYPNCDKELTVPMFVDAVGTVLHGASDQLIPKTMPAAPAEDTRPRDKAGRFLSDSQQKWSEHRQFAESHSSQECRDRARIDAGFASFLRTNLQREMGNGNLIGDPVVNLNARPARPQLKADEITGDLIAFVEAYNKMPAEEVRRAKRADFNPLGHIDFNRNLELAIKCGLI